VGRQLAQGLATNGADSQTSATISIGVASLSLPSKNFPSDNLLKAAARCLDAAKLSGGNTLKSIDVY
jgi:PleD family two-component response regulator